MPAGAVVSGRFEPLVEPLRFTRRPDALGPEVLRRLCGGYVMGPIEVVVALRGERTLTVTAPGSPPLDLVPLGGLRFGLKDQPTVTAEFELDGDGALPASSRSRSASSCRRQRVRGGELTAPLS